MLDPNATVISSLADWVAALSAAIQKRSVQEALAGLTATRVPRLSAVGQSAANKLTIIGAGAVTEQPRRAPAITEPLVRNDPAVTGRVAGPAPAVTAPAPRADPAVTATL